MGLEQLAKIYEKGVKEGNKKGFADTFKQAMKTFEKALKEECFNKWNKETSTTITFQNVKYGDGYFIFGMGDNSVVHFNLKETPGWKYGIWWNLPKKFYDKNTKKYVLPNYVEGTFFAQYEEDIDKFKPSASAICENFTIVPNEKHCFGSVWTIARHIKFIINEPYLAFCRHHLMCDYNTEYLSRAKAKHMYFKYVKEKKNREKYTQYYSQKFLKFVTKLLAGYEDGSKLHIIDRGDGWSPRYDIMAKQSDYPDLEPGCYDLFDTDVPEGAQLRKKWDAYFTKCVKRADKHGVYLSIVLYPSFEVVVDKYWKSIMKSFM